MQDQQAVADLNEHSKLLHTQFESKQSWSNPNQTRQELTLLQLFSYARPTYWTKNQPTQSQLRPKWKQTNDPSSKSTYSFVQLDFKSYMARQ